MGFFILVSIVVIIFLVFCFYDSYNLKWLRGYFSFRFGEIIVVSFGGSIFFMGIKIFKLVDLKVVGLGSKNFVRFKRRGVIFIFIF